MGASFHRTMIDLDLTVLLGKTVSYSSNRRFCGFHKLWNFLSKRVKIRNDSGNPLVSANKLSNNFKSLCLRSKYTARKLWFVMIGLDNPGVKKKIKKVRWRTCLVINDPTLSLQRQSGTIKLGPKESKIQVDSIYRIYEDFSLIELGHFQANFVLQMIPYHHKKILKVPYQLLNWLKNEPFALMQFSLLCLSTVLIKLSNLQKKLPQSLGTNFSST